MRKISFNLLLFFVSSLNAQVNNNVLLSTLSQSDFTVVERNNDGTIKLVRYAATDNDVPATANEFFISTLKKRNADVFVLDKSMKSINDMNFERYQQYYKGVKVEDGHYNFRFQNGRIKVVSGHYVDVDNTEPNPSISEEEAIRIYTKNMGINAENVTDSYVNLIIKEIKNKLDFPIAKLVYKICLSFNDEQDLDFGYIDAHTGEFLYRDISCLHSSATGYFYTYYNRRPNDLPWQGVTEYSNGKYLLRDYNRCDSIITQIGNNQEFEDNDNIWTREELGINNFALDVHWTMEQIYDCLLSCYGHASYDGNNCKILSNISNMSDALYTFSTDKFVFGRADESTTRGPFASVDIIGHEFGHAILYKTSNICPTTFIKQAVHEGLADIWGIIFESHITPNADRWKIGELIIIGNNSCIRNFQNPGDLTAATQIASTYGYGAYNSLNSHIVGGLLPYWFYLLVYGGSGTNEANNSYQLIPVGFDSAEDLYSHATLTTAYLEDCASFQEVGYALIDAALDMGDGFLAEQVKNSLYAVGLYVEPSHIYIQSSGVYYVYGNSACTVSWNFSNSGSGYSPTIVPNSYNYSCTLYASQSYSGILSATINYGGGSVTYSRYVAGPANISLSNEDDILHVVALDRTHYQLSIGRGYEKGSIRVYDSSSNQIMIKEKMINMDYVLDTSSLNRGLYIIEMTIEDKTYTTKISIK